MEITDNEINEIIAEVDHAGNGKINYREFISATICSKSLADETKLKVIF